MLDKKNLLAEASALTDYWSPKVVGEVNDQYVKVARVLGELAWHKHDEEDELFLILQGRLVIEYEDSKVDLVAGDIHIVPKGRLHNPVADTECLLALVETKSTLHTGELITEKTRSIESQLA